MWSLATFQEYLEMFSEMFLHCGQWPYLENISFVLTTCKVHGQKVKNMLSTLKSHSECMTGSCKVHFQVFLKCNQRSHIGKMRCLHFKCNQNMICGNMLGK